MVSKGRFYVGASLCSLHESIIFGVTAVFWYGCLPCLSSDLAGHHPLDMGYDWCCDDQSLHWMLGRASSLLCGCHSPIESRVCLPVVGVEAPRSSSKLHCEVGGTGALPLGKELLHIPLQGLSTGTGTLCHHLLPSACAHKIHCCWHCPRPCLRCGNAGNQLRFQPCFCLCAPTKPAAPGTRPASAGECW